MNVPDLDSYSSEEKEILKALMEQSGMIPSLKQGMVAGPAAAWLGIDWCKVKCTVKALAAGAACGGNPVCLAGVAADLLACLRDCD